MVNYLFLFFAKQNFSIVHAAKFQKMVSCNESRSQNNNERRSQISLILWFFQVAILWTCICVVIWLSLKPKNPIYMITQLHIPALNKPPNSSIHSNELAMPNTFVDAKPRSTYDAVLPNTSIILYFEISNLNERIGIYYSDINLTLICNHEVIGTKSYPGFYQGYKQTALCPVRVNIHEELRGVENSSTATAMGTRVCLETAVRYEIFSFKTKFRTMIFEAYIAIGSNGRLSTKEKIQLHQMPKRKKN